MDGRAVGTVGELVGETSPTTQGATPASAHAGPESTISVAQQSDAPRSGPPALEHPVPPHWPHAAAQQASPDCTPGTPLLHRAPAAVGEAVGAGVPRSLDEGVVGTAVAAAGAPPSSPGKLGEGVTPSQPQLKENWEASTDFSSPVESTSPERAHE